MQVGSISRARLHQEAAQLQHSLVRSEPPEALPYRYLRDARRQNQDFLERLADCGGDTLAGIRKEAQLKDRRWDHVNGAKFATGMAITLAGFAGVLASAIWPGPATIGGTVVALGLGPAMTWANLHSHSPHTDFIKQLDEWNQFLAERPENPAQADWPDPGDLPRSGLEERVERMRQRLLDPDQGSDYSVGRHVYGSVDGTRKVHPEFADWLSSHRGKNLSALKKQAARAARFHEVMSEGALDGLEDMLQGGVVVGALAGAVHPGLRFLPALAVGGAITLAGLAVPTWRSYHDRKRAEATRALSALQGWQHVLAEAEVQKTASAEELKEMAAGSEPGLTIEQSDDSVQIGPIRLKKRN